MDTKSSISVLIADDHPVVSRGFAMALADFDILVVGQADTPEDAYAQFVELQPDVFIVDIRFGDKPTGLDIAKQVFEKYPNANIVFLSQFDQDNLIKESYRLGARAFLTKNCSPKTLAEAVTEASQGNKFYTPEIAVRLANLAVAGDSSPGSILTAKELKFFILMANGKSNLEIAKAMDMSTNSVQNKAVYLICKEIEEKLGVHNQADVTRLAIKHELITP
ncbi:MAG: response regulator transcription factor [bacterium]|nr:response regulator transcription factor [bacterium]